MSLPINSRVVFIRDILDSAGRRRIKKGTEGKILMSCASIRGTVVDESTREYVVRAGRRRFNRIKPSLLAPLTEEETTQNR
jgi:hypothetical protein